MLKESGFPTVNVSAAYPMELPTVVMDNVEVGRLAARHFLDNRFTTFGYTSNTSELSTRQRCQGFVDELKTAGYESSVLSDRFAGMRECDWTADRRQSEEWLLLLKKPVAVMCFNDIRGQDLICGCQQLGCECPATWPSWAWPTTIKRRARLRFRAWT